MFSEALGKGGRVSQRRSHLKEDDGISSRGKRKGKVTRMSPPPDEELLQAWPSLAG